MTTTDATDSTDTPASTSLSSSNPVVSKVSTAQPGIDTGLSQIATKETQKIVRIIEQYLDLKNIDPKEYAELSSKVINIENKIKDSDSNQKKLNNSISKVSYDVQSAQRKVTETLGIFVALFTFVSINFQFLKSNPEISNIIGLELILLGSLMIFILLLHLYMVPRASNQELDNKFLEKRVIEQFRIIFLEKPWLSFANSNNGMTILLLLISIVLIVIGINKVAKSTNIVDTKLQNAKTTSDLKEASESATVESLPSQQ